MHARRSGGDRLDVVDAFRRLEDRVDEDRLLQPVARLQQRQILVDEGDVPGALDLRQHDDVELVADLADEPRHVVEEPRRVERIDARPQAGRAEVGRARHGDEALARRRLRFDRDRVLEVAEHDVDLRGQLADLGAQLVDVRRHEMDHALDARGRFAQRPRRADRQRLVELARNSHRRIAACRGGAESIGPIAGPATSPTAAGGSTLVGPALSRRARPRRSAPTTGRRG